MPPPPKILAFAGSVRRDSYNRRLLRVAAGGVEAAGLRCTVAELRDYPMPLYDGDLEAESGLPEPAVRFRALVADHDAFLIACPEYNGSITPLLKNTLDWLSRSPEATPDLRCYTGKVAALVSASPGPLGGMRGLAVVRNLLTNLGVTVIAPQVSIRQAHEAFDAHGELAAERQAKQVADFAREFAGVVQRWPA